MFWAIKQFICSVEVVYQKYHVITHLNKHINIIITCIIHHFPYFIILFYGTFDTTWEYFLMLKMPLKKVNSDHLKLKYACYEQEHKVSYSAKCKSSLPHLCLFLWCAPRHSWGQSQSLGPSCSPTGSGPDSGSDM